jgi:hypothetical protein
MSAGTPGHGDPSVNSYRSVMYARLSVPQAEILVATSLMGTVPKEPVWQSSYAHRSTTASPRAVAVGVPQADQERFLAVMSSVLQTTSTIVGAGCALLPQYDIVTVAGTGAAA